MQTVVRLKLSELNADFINTIKTLFKKEKELDIFISSVDDKNFPEFETKEKYQQRLNKAIENAEKGKHLISFTEEEFEEYSKSLSRKK
jgi:hypothetical protein